MKYEENGIGIFYQGYDCQILDYERIPCSTRLGLGLPWAPDA